MGFFWVGVKADMVIRNCSSVAVLCVFQGGWGAYFSLYMYVHLKKKNLYAVIACFAVVASKNTVTYPCHFHLFSKCCWIFSIVCPVCWCWFVSFCRPGCLPGVHLERTSRQLLHGVLQYLRQHTACGSHAAKPGLHRYPSAWPDESGGGPLLSSLPVYNTVFVCIRVFVGVTAIMLHSCCVCVSACMCAFSKL